MISSKTREIAAFGEMLRGVDNPRARRGYLDSFYARLVRDRGIYSLDATAIECAADLLASYGFENHADNLLSHPHYRAIYRDPKLVRNIISYLNAEITIGDMRDSNHQKSLLQFSSKERPVGHA